MFTCPQRLRTGSVSAQEDGSAQLEDSDLLDRATAIGRALFSQDSDSLAEADRRQRSDIPFAGIIYAPQQALSIRRFIEELETIAKAGEPHDTMNRVTYLPLR